MSDTRESACHCDCVLPIGRPTPWIDCVDVSDKTECVGIVNSANPKTRNVYSRLFATVVNTPELRVAQNKIRNVLVNTINC